ncbi:MAG: SLBB domain-containing protein [Planctomycetaceae bacterium]
MTLNQRSNSLALLLCLWTSAVVQAQNGLRPQSSPLRPAYNPRVAAPQSPDSARPLRLSLLGAVRQPATYICPPGTTVAQLLQATGGLTDEASGSLAIIRGARFRGAHAFEVDDPDTLPQYDLLDGDVLVFHVQRGVRDAHYRWSTADPATGVVQAPEHFGTDSQLNSIACLGLADYPVVLPLDPRQANTQSLLVDLFQMSPAAINRGVQGLLLVTTDGSLPNGAVLLFDSRALRPDDVRPKFPLPAPIALPELRTVEAIPSASVQPTPSADGAAVSPAADTAPQIQPGPNGPPSPSSNAAPQVPPRSVTPVSDQTATDGHLLSEPLPGFPFVTSDKVAVTDPVWSGAVDIGGQPVAGPAEQPAPQRRRLARPVEVVRGRESIAALADQSGTATGSIPTLPAQSLTAIAESTDVTSHSPTGIRTAEPAGPASEVETAWREVGPDGKTISTAETPTLAGNNQKWTIIGGLAIVTGLLLSAVWLWWREQRESPADSLASSPPGRTSHHTYAGPIKAASAAPAIAPLAIGDLLDNRLPIVEQPLLTEPTPQLHGEVIGQRRLRVDAAHPQVAAPHFAIRDHADEQRRVERLQRHLAATTARPLSSRPPQPASTGTSAASAPRSTVNPVRYDIVQPEAAESANTMRAPTRPKTAKRSGDLLARVLDSLREET